MSSYSSLLSRIDRRVRRLAGLRLATIAFFAAALAALAVAGAHRLGLLALGPLSIGLLFGLPAACALVFYRIGARRSIRLPAVLLALDTSLGSGERLSSLYELYRRGDRGAFRDLLERKVRVVAETWKRGLPVGPARPLGLLAGAVALAACVPLLATVPTPAAAVASTAEVREGPIAARTAAPVGDAASTPPQPNVSSAPDSAPPAATPEQTLEDELGGLWRSPDAPAVLGSDELGEGSRASGPSQGELAEDLLRQIEERLRQQGGGLTGEERRALENLARQLGSDSSLGQTLENLLSQEEGADLSEELAQARELARAPDSSPPPQGNEPAASPAPSDAERSGEESALAWQPRPAEGEGERSADGETAQEDAGSGNDDEQVPGKPRDWDEDRFGGVEGAPGEATPLATPPGFLPVDLAAPFGPTGPLREFMTKGVPLETAPGDVGVGDGQQLVVDYEMLRALLDARPLSPDTQDLVKAYFQAITQGGR